MTSSCRSGHAAPGSQLVAPCCSHLHATLYFDFAVCRWLIMQFLVQTFNGAKPGMRVQVYGYPATTPTGTGQRSLFQTPPSFTTTCPQDLWIAKGDSTATSVNAYYTPPVARDISGAIVTEGVRLRARSCVCV